MHMKIWGKGGSPQILPKNNASVHRFLNSNIATI